jgi:plasmid stabilization system protein ParE
MKNIMQIIWSQEVQQQVDAILDYLRQFSTRSADNFLLELKRASDALDKMPTMGMPSAKNSDVRSLKIKPYWRLYFYYDEGISVVVILSIFDQRQEPDKNRY